MGDLVELRARALAAKKMNLRGDTYGTRLPDDLWMQALPQARLSLRIEIMARLRGHFLGHVKNGTSPAPWELENWARMVDELKEREPDDEKLDRIGHSNQLELTAEELALGETRYPGITQRTAETRSRMDREASCPGHEFESTAPASHDHSRGWHPGRCKHCGKDMSYDSGD